MTCILGIIMVVYSERKLVNFLLRANPNINAINIPDNFDASYKVDLNGVGLKVAFSVE